MIYAYNVLADFYEGEIVRLERAAETRRRELVEQGITSPMDLTIQLTQYTAEMERIRDYPRLILETHLYGVDLDPQAAEIAVVNLMMRAMERRHREKRLPLILNQNVKIGNGLIGVRADDPRMAEHAPALADLIRLRRQLTSDPDHMSGDERDRLNAEKIRAELAQIPDEHTRALMAEVYRHRWLLTAEDTHPVYWETLAKTEAIRAVLDADFEPHFSDLERVRPFHWGVEFPEVFYNADGTPKDNPGFTIIVGNPPWEIVKPDLREFYAQFDDRIESHMTRAEVEARITELEAEDPRRPADFAVQSTAVEQTAAYVRQSPDFTRQGRGDTATHKLFLERVYGLLQTSGRIGYVVPSGIYTDLGTKDLRVMLLNEGNIQYIFSFSNERYFFPGVDHRFKFALIGAQKGEQRAGFWVTFRFNPRVAVAPADLPSFLANDDNLIYVRRQSLERFSPDSLSVMEFQTRRDYAIAEKLFDRFPLLGEERSDMWNVKFTSEFHITNDRGLFNTLRRGLPLYEGKMIHQFNPHHATAQYWLEETAAAGRLASKYGITVDQLDYHKTRLAYRGIARATDERTLMVTMLPPRVFSEGRSATTIMQQDITDTQQLFLAGCMNSFVLDWVLRLKVAANVNMFHIYSLPVARPNSDDPYFDAIVPRAARLTCTRAEFADLWREVMGSDWNESSGATDPVERQQLRDEIDALVAHLYGLAHDEFDHILGTFPLVFPDTEAGRERRAALLRIYDTISV